MVDISQLGSQINTALKGETGTEGKAALAKNKVAGLEAAFASLNMQEQMGWAMSAGFMGMRDYTSNDAFDSLDRAFHDGYSANNAHDHWNFRSMPGLSEIVTFIGGRYVQWRHQDYRLRKSIMDETDPTNNAWEYVHAPSMPTAILAKPTGVSGATLDFVADTQAKYCKEQYTTNAADVDMVLAYAEVWWEVVGGSVPDEGDSDRHAELAGDLETAYKEMSFNRASGQKDRFENRSVAPIEVISIDDNGQAIYGIAHTRVMVKKIGNMGEVVAGNLAAPNINVGIANSHGHELDTQLTDQQAQDLVSGAVTTVTLTSSDSHPHSYAITWNGNDFIGVCSGSGHVHDTLIDNDVVSNFPFDSAKSVSGTFDSTNQFKLVSDSRLINNLGTKQAVADSRFARFTLNKNVLDRIMETLPGIDGEGAVLEEHSPSFVPSQLLDRDGEPLNSAYYNRFHKYQINDAGGRSNAHRGFNDSNFYQAMTANPNVIHGRTYAIPLEIVAIAPVDNWNPYGVVLKPTRAELQTEKTAGKGVDSANPFSGRFDQEFHYLTPFGLYSDDPTNNDPADTGKTAWVEASTGTGRKMYGNGISQFTPDGVYRRRFPIYPVAQEFSYESVQHNNLKVILKDILKSIRAGTATDQEIDDAF